MKRKVLVVVFFAVVFGLPVCWYLFLQTFGENKFALPIISEWQAPCDSLATTGATLVIQKELVSQKPNEISRVTEHLEKSALISIRFTSCALTDEMVLIDSENRVRGRYVMNREEVDRLLAEMDIYVMNQKLNKSEGE